MEEICLDNYDELSHILVVDDEKDIRDGCERIIKHMGCMVHKASNGDEGITVFKENNISLVLSDLKMPGMDGIELLRRLREMDEHILVIIITGFATIDTAIEAMKQGAYDFIAKPFGPDQLRIVVGRALEKLRLRRQAKILELERLRNLADLGTEKSRIHAIIESLPNGIVVTNSKGRVVLMNLDFRKRFDIPFDRNVGDQVETYINDQGLCKLINEISQGMHVGIDKIPTYEVMLPSEIYLLARGQSVLAEDKECLGAVMIFTNITDLKNFDQLKSEFVAKVAHELRSPLSTIHEQLALVIEEMAVADDDDNKKLLLRAKEKTKGLISLIGNLLDLSRIEAGNDYNNPKQVKVSEILDGIVDFLKSRAETKGQTLTITHENREIPYVIADPLAIESIFGNLITNAIKYTQKGGQIAVKTEVIDNRVKVVVSDNGFGMDPQQQKMIFEKFYRIKNEKTRHIVGTGLGLSIVKGLVDAMEGEIRVESAIDCGSVFTVLLPIG
jgi:signal transduction histidine kinase/FixJ family two-component response regulator